LAFKKRRVTNYGSATRKRARRSDATLLREPHLPLQPSTTVMRPSTTATRTLMYSKVSIDIVLLPALIHIIVILMNLKTIIC
jgi:hypothetical protein